MAPPEPEAAEDFHVTATLDASAAYTGAQVVVVATPTNYDEESNFFDTSSVESVTMNAKAAPAAVEASGFRLMLDTCAVE